MGGDVFEGTCPLGRSAVVERYFLEHRAKVVELAAFLDRVDRASDGDGSGDGSGGGGEMDYRVAALYKALEVLGDGEGERARRVLEVLSDPTGEVIESAAGMKGATGAYCGRRHGGT